MCFWHLMCSLQKVQEGISCSWCSWLESIGKRWISVMHMSSAWFHHYITAHFLQWNSWESKIQQNTCITKKFWIHAHVICKDDHSSVITYTWLWYELFMYYGRETHIFFVHILTCIFYHYIDMVLVFIAGLCKLVDGENAHCDDLEGHSFY